MRRLDHPVQYRQRRVPVRLADPGRVAQQRHPLFMGEMWQVEVRAPGGLDEVPPAVRLNAIGQVARVLLVEHRENRPDIAQMLVRSTVDPKRAHHNDAAYPNVAHTDGSRRGYPLMHLQTNPGCRTSEASPRTAERGG